MMVLDLSSLLKQSQELQSQIDFCDLMAQKFASHDRDVSTMYQSIATTLRNLETPSSQTTTTDDRADYNQQEESQLDTTATESHESDAGLGKGYPKHAETRSQC